LIRTRHHGELLVGAAEIVETGNLRIPFVIAAPTMRVPMILADTVNPYLAARAVFLLIRHAVIPAGALSGEPVSAAVRSVAFPGLGTGVGRVDPNTCARQVRAAIEEIVWVAVNTHAPGRQLRSDTKNTTPTTFGICSRTDETLVGSGRRLRPSATKKRRCQAVKPGNDAHKEKAPPGRGVRRIKLKRTR
jgi:O-acetyl-ADP-ribose deacetylase (regulator of RNase III)